MTVENNCKNCGRVFKSYESENRKFCSKECSTDYNTEEIECKWCQEKFQIYKSRKGRKKFCSKECYSNWLSENKKETGNKVKCHNCDKKFKRSPCHTQAHNFCSNNCRAEWMKDYYTGKNNPSWKGGITDKVIQDYRDTRREAKSNYWQNRKEVLERDNYNCQKCGSNNMLVTHHKKPVMEGGSNLKSNLITLCSKCHAKVHQKDD